MLMNIIYFTLRLFERNSFCVVRYDFTAKITLCNFLVLGLDKVHYPMEDQLFYPAFGLIEIMMF